ncbi:MAG: hypothetical protein ACREU2_16325 [Steroidobacteraceae bacterium]
MLFAVFAGLYLIPRLLVIAPFERARYDATVTQKLGQIKQALNAYLSERDGVYVYGDPEMYRTNFYRTSGPFAPLDETGVYRPRCDRCDNLAEAGLLRKALVEKHAADGTSTVEAQFELTKLGKSVYSEHIRPAPSDTLVSWKFCLGKTTVEKIVEALPPVNFHGNVAVGIKYIAQVEDPNPLLFDPRSKPLRLAVPERGSPALYPPRVTTVIFRPTGQAEVEDRLRYGKFIGK